MVQRYPTRTFPVTGVRIRHTHRRAQLARHHEFRGSAEMDSLQRLRSESAVEQCASVRVIRLPPERMIGI